MELTSVRKGRIGELLVINDLLDKGYDVYTPVVDDNGVDLVVMMGDLFKKVQVKTHDNPSNPNRTSVEVNTRTIRNADVIALPVKQRNCICYIRTSEVRRSFTIAYAASLSGQKLLRNWYEDYLDFPWE
tara:strand:- start:2414 stop:2800 length:387 start_codon:yes stop_codon:yes gene_type:complete